jgi:hypothetical protein
MKSTRQRIWATIGLGIGAAFTASLAGSAVVASAATISVDSPLDSSALSNQCTLRRAIANANANAQTNAACTAGTGDDAITFAPAAQGTISLDGGELSINPTSSGTLDIEGAGPVIVSGNNSTRVLHVTSNALPTANAVTISNLAIASGKVTASFDGGAGVFNQGTLTLDGVMLDHNNVVASATSGTAFGFGGAIESDTANLTVRASTIRRNFVTATASGTATTALANGGGIDAGGTGSLRIERSTIEDNGVTATGPMAGESALGGGIATTTGLSPAVIESSTIGPTNIAVATNAGIERGGGLSINGNTSLTSDTITGNEAVTGGANVSVNVGTTTLTNTILAAPGGAGNCTGVTSAGHNIASDASCNLTGTGDLPSTAPGLVPLGDYGGPTKTRPPGLGSPAIDKGVAAGLTTDQRGLQRTWEFDIPDGPSGDGTDIGAVEIQGPVVQATNPLSPSSDQSPKVIGAPGDGSTINLFSTADCLGGAIGSDAASAFASPGIPPSSPLAIGTTTVFHATSLYGTATSACSPTAVAYTIPGPAVSAPAVSTPAPPTGARAAALKRCKKKHHGRARKRCKKKANRLPV